MFWDLLLTLTLGGVIYVQHLTILSQKRNMAIIVEKIRKSSLRTPDKKWNPKMIEGELDMVHQGKRVTIKAIFYPRKIV